LPAFSGTYRIFIGLALIALLLSAASCADKNHFGVIAAQKHGLTDYETGDLSKDWRNHRISDADHVYINKLDGCSIMVNSTCGIEKRISPVALTNHLLIDMTHREIVSQEEVIIDGRTGLRTEIKARLDGAPVQMCIYIVQIDYCIYDMAYAAHPDYYLIHLVEFEEFLTDFHVRRDY